MEAKFSVQTVLDLLGKSRKKLIDWMEHNKELQSSNEKYELNKYELMEYLLDRYNAAIDMMEHAELNECVVMNLPAFHRFVNRKNFDR